MPRQSDPTSGGLPGAEVPPGPSPGPAPLPEAGKWSSGASGSKVPRALLPALTLARGSRAHAAAWREPAWSDGAASGAAFAGLPSASAPASQAGGDPSVGCAESPSLVTCASLGVDPWLARRGARYSSLTTKVCKWLQ